ncbi:filamentous hemagglutinin N-terminal domain-containing protein [Bacterioplanoides pacificum]|uniref:Filamentous hemagglutinin N-terminal domain-containing protein n=1 Tax=Bacterioplanoides pacificum TaxID=1171596 RepID=A0ABV7VVY0_9GAMM
MAEIVPDGTTATQVSLDSLGRTVVELADADADRISHNRYQSFNVGDNGAILNNRTAGARTIINEVTGAEPSSLNGEIRVLGTRAHVVIANPNGISVNGAEVFNMASLALATGEISYQTRTGNFGDDYRNPVVNVSGGSIYIGADGLTGSLNRLELLSQRFIAEGELHNNSESAFASIGVKTGAGSHEINSRLAMSDPADGWLNSTYSNAESAVLAVDISSAASLRASRVSMQVTALGAGVRSAGNIYATANHFSLTSEGKVEISGDVKAAGDLAIEADNISSIAADGQQNTIESQFGAVALSSDSDIYLESTLLSAAQTADGGNALTLTATGDIKLRARSEEQRSILFSLQGIHLNSQRLYNHSGRILANTGLTINTTLFDNSVEIEAFDQLGEISHNSHDGKRLWYTAFLQRERQNERSIRFGEPDAGRLISEIIVAQGDADITATEAYRGYGADIIANDGNIQINTARFQNESALVGEAWMTSRCNLGGCDERGGSDVDLLGGNIQASQQLTIDASESLMNVGGTLQAVNDVHLQSPVMESHGVVVYDVLTRNKGLRGLLLKNDAIWVAVDQGGAVVSNMGTLNLSGGTLQFYGAGVAAPDIKGDYRTVREPTTQELLLRRRIGLGGDLF